MVKIYNFILTGILSIMMLLIPYILNAQCDVSYTSDNKTATLNGYDFWFGQSFTATCNGDITSISLVASQAGTLQAGDFKIYSGNSASETDLIYTESYQQITVASDGDPITIDLTTPVSVVSGNQYTFMIYKDVNYNFYFDKSGTYEGGHVRENATFFQNWDLLFTVAISSTTGMEEISNKAEIFPNPASDYLHVSGIKESIEYKVYNITGAEVLKNTISNDSKIYIKNLKSGIYFIRFENGSAYKFLKN